MKLKIPKLFGVMPFFTPSRVPGFTTTCKEFGKEYTYTFDQSLSMEHARVLLACLLFWNRTNNVSVNIVDLTRAMYVNGKSGYYKKRIQQLLQEIRDTVFKRKLDRQSYNYNLIQRLEFQPRKIHIWFSDFLHGEMLQPIYLDWKKFCEIRSSLAQCLYLYLPSRAINHTMEDPWRIKLANLAAQLGMPVSCHRSKLARPFIRYVVPSLDRAPMNRGCLRVALNNLATHDLLTLWHEPQKTAQTQPDKCSSPRIREVWIKNGGTLQSFQERMERNLEISGYAMDILERLQVDVKKDRVFLQKALNLLGDDQFNAVIGNANLADIRTHPAKYIGGALMHAIAQTARNGRKKNTGVLPAASPCNP